MVRLTSVIAITVISLIGSRPADAQSMTLTEQQLEAQRLKSLCQQDPIYMQLMREASGGSVRATYEASAAMIQCFYDNVDSRYPSEQKEKWLESISANKEKAAQLQ